MIGLDAVHQRAIPMGNLRESGALPSFPTGEHKGSRG
jgi:hypothetical protein